ncbi:MAG: transglycosylase SLT domain-containing protein [Chitinispirillaceae bacterium]|nr:transglycosylase SLT domain-containing protein [Chitinispirillaceae bacterium]
MSYYYLEVTRGIDLKRRYPLPDGAVSIGRSSQNAIVVNSGEKSVSGHHLIIYKSPERIMVQDLQSTNGTYVNEIKITEKEIMDGDEIGFGKAGPRFKLVSSTVELDLNAGSTGTAKATGVKTQEDNLSPFLEHANRDALRSGDEFGYLSASAVQPRETQKGKDDDTSITLQLRKKLMRNKMDADDFQKLMKNGKRLERVIDGGKLGSTQTSMLRGMYGASRAVRRNWLYVVFAVVIVCVTVASFFAVRSFQYRQLIEKAQDLRRDLYEYDKKIASANRNPDANKARLEKLIAEMEAKEKSYSSLQMHINEDDFGKFYSDPVEREIDKILQRFGESDYHIPREMIQRVKYHIGIYSGDLHEVIGRYIKRKEKYFPMINKVFRENNLPVELAYISMLESGFNPKALSHAGARGLWQFMPKTGVQFGLKQDGKTDERTDPYKSTVAAAQYFKELIGMFGGKSSVMLCMAAYNAGEGRIMRALRKIDDPMRNRDFWYIYRMGYLAEETNEYIPRVIALMIISANPSTYGLASAVAGDRETLEAENDFVEIRSGRQ